MAARKVSPQVREGRERALMQNQQEGSPRLAVFAEKPAVIPRAKDFPDPAFTKSASRRPSAQETVLNGSNLGELAEDEKYGL